MPKTAAEKLTTERISFLILLVACVLGLNLFIFLETRTFLNISRQSNEENARQWTKNLALALEREIAGQIERIDLVLLAAIDEVERQTREGGVDEARLRTYLQRQQQRLPHADAIRITDAQGMLRYATDIAPGKLIDLSDREHFIRLRTEPDAGLQISSPQQSRANGKWVVVFARSVTGADGSFQGMAFIPVAISSLTQTFSSIEIPTQGSITLRSADLKIIARYPPPPQEHATIGQAKVGQAFVDLLAKGATEGSYYAVTPLDGIPRQLSFRKVGEFPLLLVVGRAQSEYLAQWHTQRSFAILTDASFSLLTLLLSGLIYRYWRQVTNARDELVHVAMTDYLTGLVNRRAFIDATNGEIARSLRYAAPMSLLMFDVDHFKAINDTHGHEVGDQVLQQLAEVTRSTVREVDLVGRWGGEEFVVLLPETDALRATEVAERLRSNTEAATIANNGAAIQVTISVGCTTLGRNAADINTLIQRADKALYQAKEAGRNRIAQG